MSHISMERKIVEDHNKSIKNYIKDKLKNILYDVGISIKEVEVGGWTEKNPKTPDYFGCCTSAKIKFETMNYYSENTYYGGPGRGCSKNPDKISREHDWSYDDSGNQTCKNCGKFKPCPDYSLNETHHRERMY